MAFVQIEACAARTVTQGEILQIALASLIANRAIQRMIDQQKFQRAASSLEYLLSFGIDHHALADRSCTGRLWRLGHLLNLNEAHAAGSQWRHFWMIAIDR